MLRTMLMALVLANGAYFAWSQGYLKPLGWAPVVQSEPQRIDQQIRAGDLRVLGSEEARLIEKQLPVQTRQCLVSAVLDDAQSKALTSALEGQLPADSWRLEPGVQPARWIVYMGKYDGPDAVVRKRAELRALNVSAENLRNPNLEPGLSLGGHESQAAADAALVQLGQRGVRTARVVQERPELRGYQLHVPQADDSMRAALDALKPLLGGKGLQNCATGTAG